MTILSQIVVEPPYSTEKMETSGEVVDFASVRGSDRLVAKSIREMYKIWIRKCPELDKIIDEMASNDESKAKQNIEEYVLKQLDRCAICLEPFKTFADVTTLSCCCHYYCSDCIQEFDGQEVKEGRWLTCPQCRRKVVFYRKGKGPVIMTVRSASENLEWKNRLQQLGVI